MTDAVPLVVAWSAGGLLGAAFYGGLWWTVQRGVASARPARWFVLSLVLRLVGALAGIWLIGDGQWQRLALALLGFVMARPFVIRVLRASRLRS